MADEAAAQDRPTPSDSARVDATLRIRVRCETTPTVAALVRDAVAVWLAGMGLEVELADADVRGAAEAACVVLAPAEDGGPALARLRDLRAGGFHGGVVLLDDGAGPAAEAADSWSDEVAGLGGVRCRVAEEGDRAVAEAVARALRTASADDALSRRLASALAATHQRVAGAEVAVRLQHALNNPLAALMAEAQLLELEELAPAHRAAVARMVELCRRMAAVVRQLDVIRPVPPPAP
ncbi:MAG TPA: hypothetical protein VFS08_11540 [Gemmatimonadaceae bacterium]|nr:hypothetical protein [Gemmatimonadaceae bacterium]